VSTFSKEYASCLVGDTIFKDLKVFGWDSMAFINCDQEIGSTRNGFDIAFKDVKTKDFLGKWIETGCKKVIEESFTYPFTNKHENSDISTFMGSLEHVSHMIKEEIEIHFILVAVSLEQLKNRGQISILDGGRLDTSEHSTHEIKGISNGERVNDWDEGKILGFLGEHLITSTIEIYGIVQLGHYNNGVIREAHNTLGKVFCCGFIFMVLDVVKEDIALWIECWS